MFIDTFAGIAPASVPGFILMQLIGAGIGTAIVLVLVLYPDISRWPPTWSCRIQRSPIPTVRTCTDAPRLHRRQRRRHLRRAAHPRTRSHHEITLVVADAYPNFSICGIPHYISGEVTHWRNLAHRTYADLETTGMRLRLDRPRHRSTCPLNGSPSATGTEHGTWIGYDELVVGTGAVPVRPPIAGLEPLGPTTGCTSCTP